MNLFHSDIWGNDRINTSTDMTNQDAETYDLMHAKSVGWFFAIPCSVIFAVGAFLSFSITSALIRMFVSIPLAMFLFGAILGLSILTDPPILFSVNRKEIRLYSGTSLRNKCILTIPLTQVDTFRIQSLDVAEGTSWFLIANLNSTIHLSDESKKWIDSYKKATGTLCGNDSVVLWGLHWPNAKPNHIEERLNQYLSLSRVSNVTELIT